MIMSNKHDEETQETMRAAVRQRYGQVAKERSSCCSSSCCAPASEVSRALGYSSKELAGVPEGANLGLGCGNPQALAALREGETVLDLGAGAGLDCFLAAKEVGARGRVIGVDMTPEMVTKARANARKAGAHNIEFRLGEIEHLPVADGEVDVILSNCVINLSPDKEAVFREAFRVLKPGGRLAISDIVDTAPIPEDIARNFEALTGCVAGAALLDTLHEMLRTIGFEQICIELKEESREIIRDWFPGSGAEKYVVSATIEGVRPR
jgi:SAM-dependent methyltransferase